MGVSDPGQMSGQAPDVLDSEETGGYSLDVLGSDLRVNMFIINLLFVAD